MDERPEYVCPMVFSLLDIKEIHKCACVSKKWELYAKYRKAEMRDQAAQKRATVCESCFLLKRKITNLYENDQCFSLCKYYH